MSQLEQYIITCKQGYNVSIIEQDLIRDTTNDNNVDSNIIPDRAVGIHNSLQGSIRNESFFLTKEEITQLKNDPRIEYIQKLSKGDGDDIDGIEDASSPPLDYRIVNYRMKNLYFNESSRSLYNIPYQSTIGGNSGIYAMTTSSMPTRNNHSPNYFGYTFLTESINKVLTGKGVDLIVIDAAIDAYHQEFLRNPSVGVTDVEDPTNASRFNHIKWFEHTSLSGSDPSGHNNSFAGDHGLICASLAAGNNFGWAPEVELYYLRVNSSTTTDPTGNFYSFYDAFPLIKHFHLSKSIDPSTGYKRPTVVTISYTLGDRFYRGYLDSTDNLTHVNQIYPTGSSANLTGNNNMPSASYGFPKPQTTASATSMTHDKWVPSINADAEECSELGIIICAAAGNRYMPMAGSGSSDDIFFEEDYYSPVWESYYTYDEDNTRYNAGDHVYYHRLGPPGGNSIVAVGNIGIVQRGFTPTPPSIPPYSIGFTETSNRGPRVDIGALSFSYSPVSNYGSKFLPLIHSQYQLSINSFNRGLVGNTYSGGTSYAAPQIAGIACLWKQLNPNGNASEFKAFLKNNSYSVEDPNYPDPTGPNGGDWIEWNRAYGVNTNPILTSAQYRASDDRLKMHTWPYAVLSPLKISNTNFNFPLKIK